MSETSKSTQSQQNQHLDSFMNLFTGRGLASHDRKVSTVQSAAPRLTEFELVNIYRGEGIGTRIVDVYTEDMTRKWFKVSGDDEKIFDKELNKFDGKQKVIDILRWALLHGGAIGVLGIKDGGTYDTPVNENAIDEITHIHVFDKWRVMVSSSDLYNDPEEPNYGEPEIYTINPYLSTPFRVHESRVIRIDGKPTPQHAVIQNNFWNDSILLSGWDRVKGLVSGYNSIEDILDEFIIGVLSIDNFQALIANGKEDLVRKRLTFLDLCRRTMGTMLKDTKEEFERISSTVSGIDTLIDKLVEAVCTAYGIPVTRLVGRSPAGMNATGESDQDSWYDKITGMQLSMLAKPVVKLARYMSLARKCKYKQAPDDIEVIFKSLYTMTPKQKADLKKTNAEADAIYLDRQVLTPLEVANRFKDEEYNEDIHLNDDEREADGNIIEPDPISPEELDAFLQSMDGQTGGNQNA